jgi:hypothetical protein
MGEFMARGDKSDKESSGGHKEPPKPADNSRKTEDSRKRQGSRENLEKATTDWMKPPRPKGK